MFKQFIIATLADNRTLEVVDEGSEACKRARAYLKAHPEGVCVTDTEHLDSLVYLPKQRPFLMGVA